ncbi:MAG: Ig-like domain-containing protein [Myxococcaceae bacterium]
MMVLLLSVLSACGAQLVEFELDAGSPPPDPVADAGTDAGTDGGPAVAPTILSVLPVDTATGVALNTSVGATFSKAMDPATLGTSTFTVKQGAAGVSGAVTYVATTRTATFTPTAALGNSLVYTATVTTGAKDPQGLALGADYTWSFTTAATAAPPTVTSTTPLDLAIDVSTAGKPTATFSKAMDPATITSATFTVTQGATPVPGAVTLNGATNTATFTPAVALGTGLVYTATVTTGARDSGSVALAADYVWSFTTGAAAAPPAVIATTPLDLAINVPTAAMPTATFSRAMDPATINSTTFTLAQGVSPVSGAVALNGAADTATFSPTAPLTAGLLYTATVTTGARDPAGLALAANHVWSFTTASTPPTVLSVTPLNNAIDVSIATRPTATFSKPMDPATITALTFTLKQGLVAISGAVTFDALTNTGKFSPASPLGLSLVYTATITTGAKDAAGVALAADYVWSFTTGACSQAPIDLLSAANFVVLAGSTVTNTGPTTVTGDVGVSPGTAVTGFPPGAIVGALHAGDPTSAQGIADLTTAYNEAAGRSLCPVTVAGNLGGQTLAPGLYKSTSSLAISSGDLTLDAQGDGNAVFIFQMASTFTTTAGRQVILAGGAKSANIFWQVGSSATLGTTTAFHGTIMADQAVTLNTGATLNGRALARIAAVSLDSNTIVKPAP